MINDKIRSELQLLAAQRILDDEQVRQLQERYPTGPWDLVSLARWLTILGAVATGAGVITLGAQLDAWRTLLELTLSGITIGLIYLARWLGRSRGMVRTPAALELLASFTLQGLTVELALHYSTGSDNWPGLVGVHSGLAMALAYGLRNRLILIHALINFFLFFGAETGYVSGWGAYWLGMDYPLRFFGAGLASLAVAHLHARAARETWRSFSRVYLHFGLLVAHLALWFFSLFGYFEKDVHWHGNEAERVLFSIAWAGLSIASIWGAGRIGLSTLRTYGFTFLVINLYTFYFQFVVSNSAVLWWLHMLLVGGSLVFIAVHVEKARRTNLEP